MIFKLSLLKLIRIFQILSFVVFLFLFLFYFKLPFEREVMVIGNVGNLTVKINGPCSFNLKNTESMQPDISYKVPIKSLDEKIWAQNISEGEWYPYPCFSDQKVAIIIPYRDRQDHLSILINYLHPFLQKQLLAYGIFVIEQGSGKIFNKAALFNVGFQMALAKDFTCFVFHDVDMLPLDLSNLYKCTDNPLHLSVSIDKFLYKLPYVDLLGGVVAMTKEQFFRINGYSNLYFGWGSEDDDLSVRVQAAGFKIKRNDPSRSRFIMMQHSKDKGNPPNKNMNKLYAFAKSRYKNEGLNTLKYTFISNISESKLYRKITVQFCEEEIMKKWKKLYNLTDDL